jgi:ferredoxin
LSNPNRKTGWLASLLSPPPSSRAPRPDARVTTDSNRCCQCGICAFTCPVGIPVRDYSRRGRMLEDVACVQCGQCIDACPRGALRWTSPGRTLSTGEPAPVMAPEVEEALSAILKDRS